MKIADIDVSSSKNSVAVLRPLWDVIQLPFDVAHCTEGLVLLDE